MAKPRLLIIGGKPFNVPKQLLDHFEIAKHIEQDQAKFSFPNADYIFVITNWVNHSAISSARKAMPRTPVIWVRKGWPAMRAELLRQGLIEEAVEAEAFVENGTMDEPETVPEDPAAAMTEEELEAATRPAQEVPTNGATPEPPPSPPPVPTPKKDEAEVHSLWKAHVMKYVGDNCQRFGIDMMKAAEFFSVALHEDVTQHDLKAEFDLDDSAALSLFYSFGKSRGQFRMRLGLAPIHAGKRPRFARASPPPPAPVPVPVPSEVDRMLQEYMRLSQEKSKLIEEQHNLEAKIESVNKQLEIMKPFAEHFKGLAAAAKKVREALEQQQNKKT
jgi:hypothetical protein